MTIRSIITLPALILRRKAKPIARFDKDLRILLNDMIETMRAAPGVGLAAPQVGISKQVVVVEYADDQQNNSTPKKLYVVINPEYKIANNESEIGVEGCLSVPGLYGEVERFKVITVKGFNRHGQSMRIKAEGWLARIFQHEIDHLNGVVFTDRASRIWKPAPDEQIADNV